MKIVNSLSILACGVFLSACSLTAGNSSKTSSSNTDWSALSKKTQRRSNQPKLNTATSQASAQTHTVARNETLYSIARRYSVNLEKLRKRNGIAKNYAIYVGQKLLIKEGTPVPQTVAKSTMSTPKKTRTLAKTPVKKVIEPSNNSFKRSHALQTADNATTVSKPTMATSAILASANAVAQPDSQQALPQTNLPSEAWVWPMRGAVIRQFNPRGIGTNGIRIAGSEGQAVHAAQDGIVVYKGRGLSGYGTIVILSHDNGLLSTYGFLSKTHVKEGQKIRKRETIGTVGYANNKKLALYFEVREEGEPINPMVQISNTYRF